MLTEWSTREAFDAFLASREFMVLQGMRMLLRKDPETVLDEVVGRAIVPLSGMPARAGRHE